MTKVKKLIISLVSVLGLLIISGTVAFSFWARSASKSPIEIKAVQGENTDSADFEITFQRFRTQIPGHYTIKNQYHDSLSAITDQLFYTAKTNTLMHPVNDQLAISVGILPVDGLIGLSDVNHRRINPQTYQPVVIKSMTPDVKSFKSTLNGFEVSYFWSNQNLYAAVVISTSIDRQAQAETDLTKIIDNWQWL